MKSLSLYPSIPLRPRPCNNTHKAGWALAGLACNLPMCLVSCRCHPAILVEAKRVPISRRCTPETSRSKGRSELEHYCNATFE